MIGARLSIATLLTAALAAGAASVQAQQIYRWTDENGRLHITDTPPPPSAKSAQKPRPGAAPAETPAAPPAAQQQPYELAQAMKDYPVTLYTSPICKEACAMAREALNKRGVPFKEVQVWEEGTNEELKRVTGGSDVPALVVGRSVQKGFLQDAFDSLLDSARYPRAGILPARSQAAPKPPEDYVPPGERQAPRAEPVKPEPVEETPPAGPYAPRPPK
jgi:glutaredoxin